MPCPPLHSEDDIEDIHKVLPAAACLLPLSRGLSLCPDRCLALLCPALLNLGDCHACWLQVCQHHRVLWLCPQGGVHGAAHCDGAHVMLRG